MKRLLRALLQDRPLEIFGLYLAVQLAILPASGWLQGHGWISVSCGLVLLAVVWVLAAARQRRVRRLAMALGDEEAYSQGGNSRRGIVFLVTGHPFDASVCSRVLSLLPNLEMIGIVGSKDGFPSTLEQQYRDRIHTTHPTAQVQVERGEAYKLKDIRGRCSLLLDWMDGAGVKPHETAVDVTEGTKIMTLGAFAAAYEANVDRHYIMSAYDERNRRRPGTEHTMVVD